ncbi:MAG TPA: PKD domain-containing protein [Chitinophagaceae bacterium]|nr:PKD domain-containing protein [Chitinophagaceae bacterium]
MIWFVVVISCKKTPGANKPPIAVAGPDQSIILPIDSILLDGSASSDPDGTISEWLWTIISGPASLNIISASTAETVVRNLDKGVYQFELKVTDASGFFSKDTIKVFVHDSLHINQPPVVRIIYEGHILLPADSVYLVGSSSYDPDGQIVNYVWSKIAGPGQFNIISPNSADTKVKNLVAGVYEFELKVADEWGLSSKRSAIVIVDPEITRPVINLQLIPVGTLSIHRNHVAVTTAGSKIFFAGGTLPLYDAVSRVDIYDINSQTWSTAELSMARGLIIAFAIGNQIYFAGGATGVYDGGVGNTVTRVDIYDVTSNLWSTIEAPNPVFRRLLWGPKTAIVGSKAFHTDFTFDAGTNSWLTLPPLTIPPRSGVAVASVGNKVFFAGGSDPWDADRVDIYDVSSNTWSANFLSEERGFITTITMNNNVFFAGGRWIYSSNKIDIFDSATQVWSGAHLTQATVLADAAVAGQKILFFGNNRVDIYDVSSDTWLIADIPYSLFPGNDNIISAGGDVFVQKGAQVWRVQF